MAVPVRARDLRANIGQWGFEQGMQITLEQLLDEYAETRQHLRELVDLVDRCVEELRKLSLIGDSMKRNIEQMRRDRQHEEPE